MIFFGRPFPLKGKTPPELERRMLQERVLVLAPAGVDGPLTCAILTGAGLACAVCPDLAALGKELENGAGALVLGEEALDGAARAELAEILRRQPQWSEIPLVLLLSPGAAESVLGQREPLGNAVLLERPLVPATLVTLARSVLRARRGQYQIRNYFQERRQGERALFASQERYRRIVDSASEGIWLFDARGLTTFANLALASMLGLHPEQLLGRPVLDFVLPHERARAAQMVERCRQGTPQKADFQLQTARGSDLWVAFNMTPLSEQAGGCAGVLAMVTDITDRKRGEETRLRMAAIVESSDDAIISQTLDGKIASWNAGAERLFGYSSQEVLGRSMSILMPDDQGGEIGRSLELVKRGQGVQHLETVHLRKDGQPIQIWVTISPIRDAQGAIVGSSKIARDITDKKRVQEIRKELLLRERAARDEAERSNRMKDEFLATLSHELRTPLNAILGWAHLLLSGQAEEKEILHGIQVIERNARAQAQLVEDLLDMSRIVSGNVRLDMERVEMVPVIEAALETVRPAAEAKGIHIERMFDHSAGPVLGDTQRLQQVVWNLLSNAIKFTPRGGEVTVGIKMVNSSLELTISDSGQGINPEFLPHVFDRFRQADPSITRRHGGLGLGLSIVRHLVEAHGGTVQAESGGEGLGATFRITLPAAVQPMEVFNLGQTAGWSSGPPGAPAAPPSLAGLKVLVVDDEPDTKEVLKRMLEGCQAQVLTAGSAAEALEIVKRQPPHVLLSDIGMPGEDGYQLIRRVRQVAPELPAVALTAYARSADRHRVLSSGFQAHLAKPVEARQLLTLVAKLAGRKEEPE